MTAESFCAWLVAMKAAGLARSDAAAGRLLGISANSVATMKRRGADLRTALACRALLSGLNPYNGSQMERQMTDLTTYTVSDAIEILRQAGVDICAELTNLPAAYADVTDEIERADGEADFSMDEFRTALEKACAEIRGQ